MMIASTMRSSRGSFTLLWSICTFLVISIPLTTIGFYGGGWISRVIAPRYDDFFFSLLAAWLCFAASFVVYGVLGWLITGSRQRHAVYQVLANLDESICPHCGYDIRGHLPGAAECETRCPECGETVPRLASSTETS
jgi:hypothetical protein